MNDYKFRVIFLDEAKEFLDGLNEKTRNKIIYNVWKSRSSNNNELFKKLQDEIWEFRTLYNKSYYRLFAFWDNDEQTFVVATHGIIKKTQKTPSKEIARAEAIRKEYFNNK